MFKTQKMMIVGLIGAVLTLSACSTDQVASNTGSTVGFVAKTAVKGTVGAGKLAAQGGKKVVGSE